jgi:hypothetical protein
MAEAHTPATPRPSTRRARSITIPSFNSLQLTEVSREKQADSLRGDAYQIARILNRDIRIKLRNNNEKGLRELIWSCGVMMDKVLGGTESAGLMLSIPLQLVDKLVLALQTKASITQPVDNTHIDKSE